MNDYRMKYVPGTVTCLHVYRPGASDPAFMVRNETEANAMIELDRAQSEPLNRCVDCVEGGMPMLASVKVRKAKKCRVEVCGATFIPARLGQAVCSPACGLLDAPKQPVNQVKARKALADVERREIKVRKEKLKSRAEHAKEAQTVINRYVRLRDAHLGCISCDKPASWGGQWHCSHFRSVGAAAHLRFNLLNMNKSCSACNNFLSGNIAGYRPKLIEKIGQARVDWLECNQDIVRHDIPYLKRIKAVFTKKVRRIEQRNEVSQAWAAM